MTRRHCCIAAAMAAAEMFAQPLFKTPFSLTGTGGENERVMSDPVELSPGSTYLFSFGARRAGSGSGSVIAGPACLNVDWQISNPTPEINRFVFRTQEGKPRMERFHLGGWQMTGTIVFESASVRPVKAVWGKVRGITLGHGESLAGNVYSFTAPLGGFGRNDSRPLLSHTAWFNTHRWCLGGGQHVTYRHALENRKYLSARASVTCGYRKRGGATVEASADGETWTALGAITNTGGGTFDLPESLFPAGEIRIRVKGTRDSDLQLYGYSLEGKVDGAAEFAAGSTRYVDAETGELLEYVRPSSYYDEDYGEPLAGSCEDGIVLWSAPAARKVTPSRHPPAGKAAGELAIRTAANESEAVQLVVSPKKDLHNVRVTMAGDLTAGTARIPASAVDIRRVGYVYVSQATDDAGCAAWWPDPLLPQEAAGCSVRGGENQPFRIRVKPPKGTPKGLYRGKLAVYTPDGVRETPMTVEVFGFEMPDSMTCETAFGFDHGTVLRYHGVKDEAGKRLVLDKYLRLLADNHISPYDPAPLDRWKVKWKGIKEDPLTAEPEFDWTAWDAALEKAFGEYHFNTFRLKIDGIGGGTFHARHNPVYMGHSPADGAYHILMAKYLGGIEAHLRKKGWLDKAYVYWFDEPEPRDYEFVMEGFRTLKRHAPGLRRMLTEQPEAALTGGPDIWCPLTPHLHSTDEPACRAAGNRFWWYVCCSPKAPYVTEFIDHPGVEMRLWAWQTWKEDVHGLLIWNTTYWTSGSAYPDSPQNPYTDTMSWVSSYSTPKGEKRPWGNGDGRLVYPPLAAADGRPKAPVTDAPVPTFRLEMLGDGIEDYEYFAMLKRRLATATQDERSMFSHLLRVPQDVTRTMTDFSIDPGPVESHRVKLARALERLGTRP